MSNPPTFERDRINYLKNERILSQKKTFTKWINSFLNKVGLLLWLVMLPWLELLHRSGLAVQLRLKQLLLQKVFKQN